MTDVALIVKKLASIEQRVQELRTLIRPEDVRENKITQGYAQHMLQTAIQAALDVASHIISDERLREPSENRGAFKVIAQAGWLPADLADTLSEMVGFRNVLVHQYDDVDLTVVEKVLTSHLDDFLAFTDAIRARLR